MSEIKGKNIPNSYEEEIRIFEVYEKKDLDELIKLGNDNDVVAQLMLAIKYEEGKDVKLTSSNYIVYMKSKNREVRKSAFEAMYNYYKKLNQFFYV